jgi:TetR/AcrR family transcriptional regulator, tetracycline repressor protein
MSDERDELPLPPWRTAPRASARSGVRPSLDRARIVAAALAIVDAEGVPGLSLRRLADDLGVTPMSLYWHVADKAELLELLGNAILAEIELPPRAGPWTQQLRDVHRVMFAVLLRHQNAADVVAGRARFEPAGLVVFERILEILLDAGLDEVAAFDAYLALYQFFLGFVTTTSREPAFVEGQQQGWAYMLTLPEDRFPGIRAVTPVIGRRPPDEVLEQGLDIVIAGIEARLAPRVRRVRA